MYALIEFCFISHMNLGLFVLPFIYGFIKDLGVIRIEYTGSLDP